jgi:acetoin utilization deacetylase AcuC-like enzyme
MGFCLMNNVAITARHLADAGERVLVVDYDAHHGNGTQDAFYLDGSVMYVSTHEYPLYPGTGAVDEMGDGAGLGTTINFPLPAGATGDVVRSALDDVVAAVVDAWQPTWLLVSAGYDAHRRDPLTGMALSAGDYGAITSQLAEYVPAGRTIMFLEGGYDLQALTHSMAATVAAMAGTTPLVAGRPDLAADLRPTTGGPGEAVVDGVKRRRRILGLDELL